MAIEIDKGVPLPKKQVPVRAGVAMYPWREMQVGDSFFVAGTTVEKFSGTLYQARKRLGTKFASRTVEGGIRVWRIA